jgi:hypothetical protein
MRTDGSPVKASRLFFGNEFNLQTKYLAQRFGKTDPKYPHNITFDEDLYQQWLAVPEPLFHLESMQYPDGSITSAPETRWEHFTSYEEAYHRLMMEMMGWQVHAIRLAAGQMPVQKLYVDGGFSQSDVFIHLLRRSLPRTELIISPSPLGSSLGAAMAINKPEVAQQYQFELKRVVFP